MGKGKVTVILIIVGVIMVMTYVYYTGEFTMISSAGMQKEFFDPKETYYFGHEMKWNGLVNPTINTIYIVRNDSSVIPEDEQVVRITPFIDYSRHTGVLNEESYQEMASQNTIDYEVINNNKIKSNEFTLVLRVKASIERLDYEIKGIVINYRVLGVPKKQVFEYQGFLTD